MNFARCIVVEKKCRQFSRAFSGGDHVALIARQFIRASRTIDAQIVVDYMVTVGALDPRDLEQIRSRREEPIRAAETLLDIVRQRPYEIYVCFMDALFETGQHDVRELIETGNSRGTIRKYSIDRLLPDPFSNTYDDSFLVLGIPSPFCVLKFAFVFLLFSFICICLFFHCCLVITHTLLLCAFTIMNK